MVSYRPGIVGESSDSYLHPEAESTYRGKDRGPLFHNKFNMELDRVVMTCMEGELKHRNKLEFVDNSQVDMCTEIHESFHFGLKVSNLVELKIRALQAILDMEPPLKMFRSVFMHLLKVF